MTRSIVPVFVLMTFATSLGAQELSKVDIFGGYSYVHMVSTSQGGPLLVTSFASANLSGWNGSLQYKPIRWLESWPISEDPTARNKSRSAAK